MIPPQERGRWVFEVAPKLYNLQKARFGYLSRYQTREKKLAWALVKLEHGPEYIKLIAKTIANFDMNDLATLETYWKILENAESDQDFARILTFDSMHPDSQPSNLFINLDYDDYFLPTSRNNIDATNLERIAIRYNLAKANGKVLSPTEFLGEVARYGAGIGGFVLWNSFKNVGSHTVDDRMVNIQTVPCTLAGLPLRHIQEIEIARSGKILKFRATGSVFLAQQEGGDDAVRIEGILARSEIIWILFLWMIFYFGQGKVKEIEKLTDTTQLYQNPLLALRSRNVDITSFNKETSRPSYEHHFTVPFVTRHIILPNVYIETLSFEEKVVFGKDVIKYTILLRTYRKDKAFDVYHTDSPTLSLVAPKSNTNLMMFKILEFFANFSWRLVNMNGLFIKEREWKIGGDSAESDDVYYNIDAYSLASSVALGVAGII